MENQYNICELILAKIFILITLMNGMVFNSLLLFLEQMLLFTSYQHHLLQINVKLNTSVYLSQYRTNFHL